MADKKFLFLNDNSNVEEAAANSTLALGGLTMSGAIAMGTNKITGLGNGTVSTDAVTFGQLQAALAGLFWVDPVSVLRVKSDADQSGTPPTAGSAGEAWVVTNWGSGYNNGDIVEWDGDSWVIAVANSGGEPPNGTRVIVIESSAAGAFVGQEESVAEYNSTTNTWTFTAAADGMAAFVIADGSYYADAGFTFNGTSWVQFTGTGAITAGNGLEKVGNVLNVLTKDGVTIDSDRVTLALTADAGLQLTGTSPNKTLGLKIVSTDRLSLGVNGLDVVGLPSLFEINGTAVGANVTATNLDTLTGGGDADALHTHPDYALVGHDHDLVYSPIGHDHDLVYAPIVHEHTGAGSVENSVTAHVALLLGDPVVQHSQNNEVNKADADTEALAANVLGVALTAADADAAVSIVCNGLALGVLGSSGVAGTRYYLASGGGLTTTPPSAGKNVVLIGWAKNAADLWVEPRFLGKRA